MNSCQLQYLLNDVVRHLAARDRARHEVAPTPTAARVPARSRSRAAGAREEVNTVKPYLHPTFVRALTSHQTPERRVATRRRSFLRAVPAVVRRLRSSEGSTRASPPAIEEPPLEWWTRNVW